MILAMDPGKANFAWAALKEDGTVVDTGMLKTPLASLEEPHLSRMARGYRLEVQALLAAHRPARIVVERYEQRQGPGAKGQTGASGEYVNVMIGALLMIGQDPYIPVTPVPAREWKAWLGRATTGKQALESAASVFGIHVTKAQTAVPITDHQADACGQGLWLLGRKTQGYESKALIDRAKASMQDIWTARLLSRKK